MTIQFTRLQLRAVTGRGRFGVDISLPGGLVILRAPNSRGKSTTIKSILFALGLERMISPKPAEILSAAMRDRLIYDSATKMETPVVESWVNLEMTNSEGEVATVTRWVKHPDNAYNLVRITHGPALTEPKVYSGADFYTGRPGSAANPRGYQRWLADFIGWSMPELATADGKPAPLYVEQVFPLVFVEQRRGWAGIQSQMPYFSGVPDVKRRAIEFLLRLDVGKLESEKRRLRGLESEVQNAWRAAVRTFQSSLVGTGLVLQHVPDSLVVAWPLPVTPLLLESRGQDWIPIDEVTRELVAELAQRSQHRVPLVSDSAGALEGRLQSATAELQAVRDASDLLREDSLRDRQEINAVRTRLAALREDLRQHQDLVVLGKLGSIDLDRLQHECPVCHQSLPESLLDAGTVPALTPEEAVAYIQSQIDLFRVMENDGNRSFSAKQEKLAALQLRMAGLRQEIRSLQSTLVGPNGAPSAAAIAATVRLEQRLADLRVVTERFHQFMGELGRFAEEGLALQAQIRQLPADRLSVEDRNKLALLQQSFVSQLHAYGFGSFSDSALRISDLDYLPRRDDFDLQADISASDAIRVIWAYLVGLLDVANKVDTDHPGILIFDEPRQQSANPVSFEALLRRAAEVAGSRRQVIFATSEELESLEPMLRGVKHSLIPFDDYILQPVVE